MQKVYTYPSHREARDKLRSGTVPMRVDPKSRQLQVLLITAMRFPSIWIFPSTSYARRLGGHIETYQTPVTAAQAETVRRANTRYRRRRRARRGRSWANYPAVPTWIRCTGIPHTCSLWPSRCCKKRYILGNQRIGRASSWRKRRGPAGGSMWRRPRNCSGDSTV